MRKNNVMCYSTAALLTVSLLAGWLRQCPC